MVLAHCNLSGTQQSNPMSADQKTERCPAVGSEMLEGMFGQIWRARQGSVLYQRTTFLTKNSGIVQTRRPLSRLVKMSSLPMTRGSTLVERTYSGRGFGTSPHRLVIGL